MKKPIISIFIFIVLAVAQWLFTGSMIYNKESVLRNGKAYRFKTEPVDPSDPFKGRYIYLSFKEREYVTSQPLKEFQDYSSGEELYVLLTTDSGYAKIAGLSAKQPLKGDYIKAKFGYINNKYEDDTLANKHYAITIDYPFTEFYMDEYKAPKAETAYREANRNANSNCYALVKVLNGDAVTENVFINDKPISGFTPTP